VVHAAFNILSVKQHPSTNGPIIVGHVLLHTLGPVAQMCPSTQEKFPTQLSETTTQYVVPGAVAITFSAYPPPEPTTCVT